jgi:hypothetical protein
MRLIISILAGFALQLHLCAQGTPPMGPEQRLVVNRTGQGPPQAPVNDTTAKKIKTLVKKRVNAAIMGRSCQDVSEWRPLTSREKFHVFVAHTYSPITFANAGIDSLKDKVIGDNREYERGWMGLGQHYGIQLATSETNVFFERFLIPTLLKQDPRYFRNPDLPFFKRALYSMSRVLITRSDNGHETFNASKVLGGAASQALSDLYVPGQGQGMGPIRDRVTFDLARDAGMNLLHEFWPDLRRKLFHR